MNLSSFNQVWKICNSPIGEIVIEKDIPFNSKLEFKFCDRTFSIKRIEELIRSGIYILIEEDYSFALQCLNQLKKSLNKSKPKESNNIRKTYRRQNEWRQNKSVLTNRLLFKSEKWKSILDMHKQLNLAKLCEITLLTNNCFSMMMPMKQVLALNASYQRYIKGFSILGFKIHPFYSVYVPIRIEPVLLVRDYLANCPKSLKMLEIGVGSGILSFVANNYGHHIDASDSNLLAILSTENNCNSLNIKLSLHHQKFYIDDKYDIIICNPPWIPKSTENLLDRAIFYSEDFFHCLFSNLSSHLTENGKLILIYSNFAAIVGLQSPKFIVETASKFNLMIKEVSQFIPNHKKVQEKNMMNSFRKDEVVSLYEITPNN